MHNLKLHKLFTKNTIFASVIQNARTTGFEISVFRIQTVRKKKFERVIALWFIFVFIKCEMCFIYFWDLTLDTSKIFDNKEVHLLPLCTFWTKIFIYLCCWDAVFINKKKKEHGIFHFYTDICFSEIHSRIWCTFKSVYVQRGPKEGSW